MLTPDLTIVIQVAFFILFWIVFARVVVAPMRAVLAERARRTVEARREAEATAAGAQAERARYDDALREQRLRMAHEAESARHAAIEESNREIAAARTNIALELGHRREQVAKQVGDARRQLGAEAEQLAAAMLDRVAGTGPA